MQEQGTGLRVFKFGGASVKDAAAILNLCAIVKRERGPLLVVVSAMGKTTNALEEIYDLAYHGQDYSPQLAALEAYHHQVSRELSAAYGHFVELNDPGLTQPFEELAYRLTNVTEAIPYDEGYDQVVSFGELLSSYLVYSALSGRLNLGAEPEAELYWRSTPIITDATWREGKVEWELTKQNVLAEFETLLVDSKNIIVTEGFVGQTSYKNRSTTLGREGSDYTAAILAYCLQAESVTIWKDVPGLLNADPKVFVDTVLYPEISYAETIEMAFYGASVIHPKTIKPLAERRIPLYVKSFLDSAAPGTVIHDCQHPPLAPAFIRKTEQCLISFESKDFAFISEENLGVIFGALAQARLKINLMQNSALSFSVCTDYSERRLGILLELLSGQFRMHYNSELVLFTIKNYDAASIGSIVSGRKVLLEQRTRGTFQAVCAA